jgi:cell division protein FtsB
MQKLLFLCLIGIIVLFQMQLMHGHGGYVDDERVKHQIDKQKQINAELKDRNSMTEIKIAGLKGSTDSIEARARNELNLVKPGEVLILLPGSDLDNGQPKK